MSSPSAGPMLAHSVYFTLEDNSDEAIRQLIAACKQCLSDHPGTVFFAVGRRAEEIEWSISDRNFDVALHIVFESKAAHDAYQDSPRHGQFIEENEANWKQIRAVDAYVEGR
jgi:quinol monooxygenase YgiN